MTPSTSEAGRYSLVGCRQCEQLWVVENLREQDTAECSVCEHEHQTDKLRALSHADDIDKVCEIRSRIIAERAGYAEEYDRMENYAGLREQAEHYLGAYDDVYASELTDTIASHRDLFADVADRELFSLDQWLDAYFGPERDPVTVDANNDWLDYVHGLEKESERVLGSVVTIEDQFENHFGIDREPEPLRSNAGRDDQDEESDVDVVGNTHDETGSLRFSTSVDTLADAYVEGVTNATDLHKNLFATDAPLQDELIDAAIDIAEDVDYETSRFIDRFEDLTDDFHGPSVGGSFLDLLVDTLEGRNAFLVKKLVSQLGNNNFLDVRTGLDDVYSGPFTIFRGSDRTPKVVVQLPSQIFDTDSVAKSTRENLISYITELARGCDVRIVASGLVQTRLLQEHREVLPASVIDSTIAHLATEEIHDDTVAVAMDALSDLDYNDSAWTVLEVICEGRHDTAWYTELRNDPRLNFSRTRLSQCLSSLRDADLIVTDGPQNDKYAIATPAGTEALDALKAQIGKQYDLDSFDRDDSDAAKSHDGDGSSEGVSETPDSYPDPCESAGLGVVREGDSPADGGQPAAAARADAEAEAVTAQTRRERRNYADGTADIETLAGWEHNAAQAAAPTGGVGLDDVPIGGVNWNDFADGEWTVDRLKDKRSPIFSYDSEADEIVVGGEFHTAFQFSISLARSLLSPIAFDRILTETRLDGKAGELESLLNGNKAILRDKRCLGWLKDSHSGSEYREALQDAIQDLEDLTEKIETGNFDDDQRSLRREIMRFAHGLIGTVTGIYDLLDVDVTRLVRIPGRYSTRVDRDRQEDLLHFMVRASTISSTMGAYTQSRVQFEPREDKRTAIGSPPEVDAADPTGTHIGQWSITGYGVLELQDALEDAFENPERFDLELQTESENYTDFTVDLPIAASFTRENVSKAVRRALNDRGMRPTRHAISVMQAFTGSIHDVAKALFYLGNETGRKVRVDDLKFALSHLSPARILPTTSGSVKSKIVHALITSAFPLTQSDLVDRAGISAQSFRNHRDELEAFGLIRETTAGWVVCLKYRNLDDRMEDVDEVDVDEHADSLPWYAIIEDDSEANREPRNHREETLRGALFEAVIVLEDVDSATDPDHQIGSSFYGVFTPDKLESIVENRPSYVPMVDFVLALREEESLQIRSDKSDGETISIGTGPTIVTLGRPPDQTPIVENDESIVAALDD